MAPRTTGDPADVPAWLPPPAGSGESLATLLLRHAETEPGPELYAVDGAVRTDRISVGELAQEAARCASALRHMGVGPGDTVAIWAPNSPSWLTLLMAVAWRGAAVAAIHAAAGPADLAGALAVTRPSVLFHTRTNRGHRSSEVLERAVADAPGPAGRAGRCRIAVIEDDAGFPGLANLAGYGGPVPTPWADASSPLAVLFTSGSSGAAKAAVLSHRALLANALLTARQARIGRGDRLACPLPFYHCAGLGSGALLALATGARLWTAPRFDPGRTLAAIARERCTVLLGVPTTFLDLARHPRAGACDLASLRMGLVGGAHCDAALSAEITAALRLRELCRVYGLTECGPTVTCEVSNVRAGPPPAHCGQPLPGVRIRISAAGEILVQSPTLMAGYLSQDGSAQRPAWQSGTLEQPAESGWMRTGDLGYLAPDGQLVVTGRSRDMIVRGGENVAPREVESVLRSHPAVGDACVVGIPSSRLGEDVAAAVETVPGVAVGVDALAAHCAARLAAYERPTALVVLPRLPRLPNGKTDRVRVAAMIRDTAAHDAAARRGGGRDRGDGRLIRRVPGAETR